MEGAAVGHEKISADHSSEATIHLAEQIELLTPGLGKMYAI